ncbi:hypothetical protein Golob_019670 [Gossypium lobatum]|uniref:Uncharacterized protein n=1 Tax=Gossypium lobatum TaxID=34289 RepID=A0A7J8L896_9ROSI|nr:hypothetical protein [Gossypium lobatum]
MRVQTRGWGTWLPLFVATVRVLKCLLQAFIGRLHLGLFAGPFLRYHLLRSMSIPWLKGACQEQKIVFG